MIGFSESDIFIVLDKARDGEYKDRIEASYEGEHYYIEIKDTSDTSLYSSSVCMHMYSDDEPIQFEKEFKAWSKHCRWYKKLHPFRYSKTKALYKVYITYKNVRQEIEVSEEAYKSFKAFCCETVEHRKIKNATKVWDILNM